MISLKITDVKDFMSKLLTQIVFDNFYISKVDVVTYNSFTIDCRLNRNFFSDDEWELFKGREYSKWSEVRQIVFQLIKGKKTPLSFKIVLMLSTDNICKLIESSGSDFKISDINGLFINIKYDNGNLNLITGSSVKIFSMDKTLDLEWDNYIGKFLKYHEISYED